MKISKKIGALLTLTLVIAGTTFYSVGATSTITPGTSGDPIVTKSYVDESINNLLVALSQTSTSTTSNQQAFVPVQATVGQIVIGGEGAEIILRSGVGVSYTEGTDGLINVTTGEEYLNGSLIEPNNLIIVPRNDGRGIVVSSEEAWFIIKGGYTIQ